MTIRDLDTQRNLEGVIIYDKDNGITLISDALGQLEVSIFKNSTNILISFLGYKTQNLHYRELERLNFEVYMEATLLNLDMVVVSATRWRQSGPDTPSKIVSISNKDIALQNPQTAADLLGISGKVFIQKSQQGGGSPMIRGFATNRLIYTVDGVRMNNAIFRGGNVQNVINLDPFIIENTEILFGPSSVIYGSDAIGGVMSFYTLTPQFSDTKKPTIHGKANTRYSSANKEKTGHFDINIGLEKWAFLTSVSLWDYDDLRQGQYGPNDYIKNVFPSRQNDIDIIITQDDPLLQVPSAYSQMNIMQKLRFQPDDKWNFEYGFHYSTTSKFGRYDRHNRLRNGTLRYSEWDYGPQSWMMNNLSVSHQGDNALYDGMSIKLAHQNFGEIRLERNFNQNIRTTTEDNVAAYSVNWDFTKKINTKNTIFYGVEYVHNDVISFGNITNILNGLHEDSAPRYPKATWASTGMYFNNEFKISDKMRLQTGLRYSQFSIRADFSDINKFYEFPFEKSMINNGTFTGSVGAVYRPSDTWVMKVNLGTAFRSPNVDDIGKIFDSEPGAVVVPNPNLRSEYACNADIGIAKILNESIKVDIAGYYTRLENALVRRNFQFNGRDSLFYLGALSQVQAIQNAANAQILGVQLGIEFKISKNLLFLSDINYQRGEEEMDDGSKSPSRHAAPTFGISRLRYSDKKLTLEINSQYQGERKHHQLAVEERNKSEIYAKDTQGNTFSPAWYTLNFRFMYALTKKFEIGGGIENISDQRYRPFSSGISGPGRNFVISAGWKF